MIAIFPLGQRTDPDLFVCPAHARLLWVTVNHVARTAMNVAKQLTGIAKGVSPLVNLWAIPWLLTLHFLGIGPTLNAIYFTQQFFHSSCIVPRPYSVQIWNLKFEICTLYKRINAGYSRYIFRTCIKCCFFSYIHVAYMKQIYTMIILCWVRSGYKCNYCEKNWWVKYILRHEEFAQNLTNVTWVTMELPLFCLSDRLSPIIIVFLFDNLLITS